MNIMIFDTAGTECVVSLFNSASNNCYESRNCEKNQHSESLFPLTKHVLENAKLSMADITDVAVIVGPGSFTGLRVSLSAVEGFKLASNITARGISLLELQAFVMSRDRKNAENIVSMMQSQKGSTIHYQVFDCNLFPLTEIITCPLSDAPYVSTHLENCTYYGAYRSAKVIGEYVVYKLSHKLPETKLFPIYAHFPV